MHRAFSLLQNLCDFLLVRKLDFNILYTPLIYIVAYSLLIPYSDLSILNLCLPMNLYTLIWSHENSFIKIYSNEFAVNLVVGTGVKYMNLTVNL